MTEFIPPRRQYPLVAIRAYPPITLSPGQLYSLPGGAVLASDGTITYPGGGKLQFVIEDREIIGQQLFKPDGSKLQPGEVLVLPDGTTIEQQQF